MELAWTRRIRFGCDCPGPLTDCGLGSTKVCHFGPFCAIPICAVAHLAEKWHRNGTPSVPLVLSEAAHRVTGWHAGVPPRPGHGRERGLESSAGECFSQAQISTGVLLRTRAVQTRGDGLGGGLSPTMKMRLHREGGFQTRLYARSAKGCSQRNSDASHLALAMDRRSACRTLIGLECLRVGTQLWTRRIGFRCDCPGLLEPPGLPT